MAVVLGLCVGAVAAWLVAAGALRGLIALAVVAVCSLLVPTSRELARRGLISGCVFLGWVPLTWWWRLPLGRVGHLGLVLAVVAGGLTVWVAWQDPGRRLRSLVPRLRWTDGALGLGVVGTAWINLPGLRTVSPEVALSRFLRGWDNSAHFDMTEMIRRYGVMIVHAPPGPLGRWAYDSYPQGFHAAAATVMEALVGVHPADAATELAAYARALTIVVAIALVTVVAGLCSLPALRRRPLIALPLVVLVVATFGLGPGGLLLHDGFPNYVVGVAMLCCIPPIVVQMARPGSSGLLMALSGAVLGIAHNWSLLLVMGFFGVLAAFWPWRRSRWPRSAAAWIVPALIGAGTAAGLVAAWSMLRKNPSLGDILTTNGGITFVPLSATALSVGLAIALCVLAGAAARHARASVRRDAAVRAAVLGLLPAAGLVLALAVAGMQIRQNHDVSYYFWKCAIALQIVSVVVVACTVPLLVPSRAPASGRMLSRAGTAAAAVAASLVASLALGQMYGLAHQFPTSIGGAVAPGIVSRADYAAIGVAPTPPDTIAVLDAVRAADHSDAPHVFMVANQSKYVPQMMLAQWYAALTGGWMSVPDALMRVDVPPAEHPEDLPTAIQKVLSRQPNAEVIVDPAVVDRVRTALSSLGLAGHVTSW